MDIKTNHKTPTNANYIYADGQSIPYTLSRSQMADCCSSARALFKVTFEFGELYFCHHHYNKHKSELFASSVSIVDESSVLVK